MLAEADELGHGSQVLIQVIESIRAGTRSRRKPGEAVQRPVNAAVIGEIHKIGGRT